ncbi:prolyl hydroxylase family protein [Hyphobacterium sp.]|uniref:prolyl hydroxylase family protein n=1 Tax=Hyphobacterium sp. TaxID=2004662 RepID=UPI003BAD9200
MRSPALQQAEAAFQSGRAGEARNILREAASTGDAAAAYSLAVALAYGQGGEIDLPASASLLAEIRDRLPAARMFHRFALAQGWDGISGWEAALADLMNAARAGDPTAQREAGLLALLCRREDAALALLGPIAAKGDMPAAMALMRLGRAGGGQPWLTSATAKLKRARHPLAEELAACAEAEKPLPGPAMIDWDALAIDLTEEPPLPGARTLVEEISAMAFPGALPPAVGDHVLTSGLKALQPSTIVDETTGQRTRDPHRQSLSMTFAPHLQDLVHVAVERLMARMADCPASHTERLNLLFYRPGEQYRPHVDYFAPDDGGGAREIERAGQRVATSLICLHAATGGGATRFVRFATDWNGASGDGLSFRNVRPNGDIEPLSLHQGEKVTNGWKALASLWIRDR